MGACVRVIKLEALGAHRVRPHRLEDAEPRPGPEVEDDQRLLDLEAREARLPHLEREAWERGFAEGERAGSALAQRKSQQQLENLARGIEALETERERLLESLRHELVDVVLLAAGRIVGAEIAADPALVRHAVAQALGRLESRTEIELRLHPQDAERLEALLRARTGPRVSVVTDAELTPGGCIVNGPDGEVDARLETRLEEVAAALRRAALEADQCQPESAGRVADDVEATV
jgi:flagellar assembly protein FliH